MPRIYLDFADPHKVLEYSELGLDDIDNLLSNTHTIIHCLSQDIVTLSQVSEADWTSTNECTGTFDVVPRKDDLLRTKREELDREYERRDALQKIFALKELGVL